MINFKKMEVICSALIEAIAFANVGFIWCHQLER